VSLKAAGLTAVSSFGVTVIGVKTTFVLSPSPSPPPPDLGSGEVSPACRGYRTPLAHLLDVSGAVAATAWSSGAALMSSYLITGATAAEAQYGCQCVERYEPAPPPSSPTPPASASPFTTIATTGDAASGDFKYSGAVAIGEMVYFVPDEQNNVGVFNATSNIFSTIAKTGECEYSGGAAVGTKVVFAPNRCPFGYGKTNVGVLDTTDNTFVTFTASEQGYQGAVAVGTKVYFAPGYIRSGKNVGVFDTVSYLFSTVDTSSRGYDGAAAMGTRVYFVPYDYRNVGVLDTVTNAFTTIDTGAEDTFDSKYSGAVTVGNKVYMAPRGMDTVGVVDTATNSFSTIATTGLRAGHYARNYQGAAVVGDKVYFTPYSRDSVGVLDTTTNVFSTIALTGQTAGSTFWGQSTASKYSGAARVGTRVIFAPCHQDNVGVLETYASLPPSPPPAAPPPPPPALTDAAFNAAIASCLVGRCQFTLSNPR